MLTDLQIKAIDVILEGHNVVLTGQAGTGKSFILHEAYKILSKAGKTVSILCTTGMACLQYLDCRCSTVHSWAGLLDGRYDNLTLINLIKEDDRMYKVRKNVLETDILLIDEVSMLSRKDFEQLELVCRTILNPYKNFGGIQIVACGDFYQLPPVGNTLYGDSGQFCFQSNIWNSFFVHRINFDSIIRQSEPELIKAVSETARGSVSYETDVYLKSLQRDIDATSNTIHLFATNLDSRIYNHEKLRELNTDGKVFEAAKNKGSDRYLKRILAPIFLHVKIGCPVILLRNLGGKLMNGLKGHVTGFSDNEIEVKFDLINQVHSIQRYNFTVIDMETQEVIAEREQFPLCLAYGLTIHKSQGMTIESIIIHCRGIFESGQLSVGLGRGTHTSGIQLLNYRKGLCFQPKKVVTEFYRRTSLPFEKSLQCCNMSNQVCMPDMTYCLYDSDDSDFDQNDIEEIQDLIEREITYDDETKLPDCVDIDEIRTAVSILRPFSEKQRQITSICLLVSDQQLKKFLIENLKRLQTFLPSQTPTTPKVWTDMLSKYHMYISEVSFKDTLSLLYGQLSLSDNHVFVATKFVYKLLQILVHNKAEGIAKEKDNNTLTNQKISEAGKAKLRYMGGMCVAKCKQQSCGLIENNLGSEKKNAPETIKTNTEKVKLLKSLQAEIDEIDKNDVTFSEIERRQNIRKGLTYITDSCFHFFLSLDGTIRSVLNAEKLRFEKANVFEKAKSELLNDQNLQLSWAKLSLGINSSISHSVFENLISRFLMVSQKQFLKDIKDTLSFKKKKAQREEMKKKSKKKKSGCRIVIYRHSRRQIREKVVFTFEIEM